MLVSLREDKAKKLAQVMSSPTCIKILEHLTGKDATETAIAKDLVMPLSTVHYNIQQLVEAKLVVAEEFHYSAKGREVNHYRLANKYIIIAPQEDDPTLLARLKKFIPITIITVALAAVLKTMQFFTGNVGSTAESARMLAPPAPLAEPLLKTAALPAVQSAADQAANAAVGGATPEGARLMTASSFGVATNESANATLNATASPALNETLNQSVNVTVAPIATNPPIQPPLHIPWWQSEIVDYFLLGAFFVLAVLLIAETIAYLRAKRGKG